jgi:ankyrin repeat protein
MNFSGVISRMNSPIVILFSAVCLTTVLRAAVDPAVSDAIRTSNLSELHRLLRNDPREIANHLFAWDGVILRASESGHADLITLLATNRVSVNHARGDWLGASAGFQTSALHLAAGNGHVETVAALLKARARVDARDMRGSTPLFVAVGGSGYPYTFPPGSRLSSTEIMQRRVATVALLLDAGADICATNREYHSSCALDQARRNNATDMVALLLTRWKPGDVHPAGSGLHVAAQLGLAEIVEQLATNRAALNATNGGGFTPLQLAALSTADWSRIAAELLLRRGATLDLFSAAALGKVRELELFLTQDRAAPRRVDSLERTALHWSAAAGQAETTVLLLRAGATSHARDGDGRIPLSSALALRRTNAIELLLRRSPVNDADLAGQTPLHIAASVGNDRAAARKRRQIAGDRCRRKDAAVARHLSQPPFIRSIVARLRFGF